MTDAADIVDRLREFARQDRTPAARTASLLVEAAVTIDRLRSDIAFHAFLAETETKQDETGPAIPSIRSTPEGPELSVCAPSLVALCDRLDIIATRRHWARRLGLAGKSHIEGLEELPEYIAARTIELLYPHAMPSLEDIAAEDQGGRDGP
jgi:hypothetical protein